MKPKERAADGLCNGMAGIVQIADSAGELQMYDLRPVSANRDSPPGDRA